MHWAALSPWHFDICLIFPPESNFHTLVLYHNIIRVQLIWTLVISWVGPSPHAAHLFLCEIELAVFVGPRRIVQLSLWHVPSCFSASLKSCGDFCSAALCHIRFLFFAYLSQMLFFVMCFKWHVAVSVSAWNKNASGFSWGLAGKVDNEQTSNGFKAVREKTNNEIEEWSPRLCWVKEQGAGSKRNFPWVRVILKYCADRVNETSWGIETELVLVYALRVLAGRGSAGTRKKRNGSFIPRRGVCGSYSQPVQTWEKAEIMSNSRQGE